MLVFLLIQMLFAGGGANLSHPKRETRRFPPERAVAAERVGVPWLELLGEIDTPLSGYSDRTRQNAIDIWGVSRDLTSPSAFNGRAPTDLAEQPAMHDLPWAHALIASSGAQVKEAHSETSFTKPEQPSEAETEVLSEATEALSVEMLPDASFSSAKDEESPAARFRESGVDEKGEEEGPATSRSDGQDSALLIRILSGQGKSFDTSVFDDEAADSAFPGSPSETDAVKPLSSMVLVESPALKASQEGYADATSGGEENPAALLLPVFPKERSPLHRRRVIWGIAFVVLSLAVGGGYLYFQKSLLPRKWQAAVQTAVERGDLPSARLFVSRLEERRALDASSRMAFGRFLLEEGENGEALDILSSLYDPLQPDGELLLLLGIAQSRLGETEEAGRFLRDALIADPSLGRAYEELGVLAREGGHLEEAVEAYRQALEIDPERSDLKGLLGDVLTDLGRWSEAIPLLEEALASGDKDPRLSEALAVARGAIEEENEQLLLKEEKRRRESAAFDLRAKGQAALPMGRYEDALDCFRRAGELLGVSDNDCLRGEAFALLGLNRYEEAIPLFEALLKSGGDDGALLKGLEEAVELLKEERLCRRREELRQKLAEARSRGDEKTLSALARQLMVLDPSDVTAPIELGRIALRRGDLNEGERFFRQTLSLDGGNAEASAGLERIEERRRELRRSRARRLALEGTLLSESGEDPQKAISCLREALNLYPGFDGPLFPLARTLESIGDLEGAEKGYRTLLERAPGQGRGWNNLGLLLYRQRRLDEAKRALLQGLEAEPMSREIARNLAISLLLEGEEEEALKVFRRYFSLDPYGNDEELGKNRIPLGWAWQEEFPFQWSPSGVGNSAPLPQGLPFLDERKRLLVPLDRAVAETPDESDAYLGFLLSLGVPHPLSEFPDLWSSGLSLVSAHSLLAQGRFPEASFLLEGFPFLGQDNDRAASMLLGHVFLHLQRYSEARESYRKAFLLDPGDVIVRESLRRLLEAYASQPKGDQ